MLLASEYTYDSGVFTLDATVSAPNMNGVYYGKLIAEDSTHPGEKETATTDASPVEWLPPCYLEVMSFTKSGQEHTIDHLYVEIDMSVSLAQHGDKAC